MKQKKKSEISQSLNQGTLKKTSQKKANHKDSQLLPYLGLTGKQNLKPQKYLRGCASYSAIISQLQTQNSTLHFLMLELGPCKPHFYFAMVDSAENKFQKKISNCPLCFLFASTRLPECVIFVSIVPILFQPSSSNAVL